jgi:hypothetical protein
MNLMTRRNQTRHQLLSNRSRRTCHKHSHHQSLRSRIACTPIRQDSNPGCDTPEHKHDNAGGRQRTRLNRHLQQQQQRAASCETRDQEDRNDGSDRTCEHDRYRNA